MVHRWITATVPPRERRSGKSVGGSSSPDVCSGTVWGFLVVGGSPAHPPARQDGERAADAQEGEQAEDGAVAQGADQATEHRPAHDCRAKGTADEREGARAKPDHPAAAAGSA